MPDIATKLHSIELNFIDCVVRALLRGAHGFAQRGNAQHAATARYQLLILECSTGVKRDAVVIVIGQMCDCVAVARMVRVTRRCNHDAKRGTAIPFGLDLIEPAIDRRIDQTAPGWISIST